LSEYAYTVPFPVCLPVYVLGIVPVAALVFLTVRGCIRLAAGRGQKLLTDHVRQNEGTCGFFFCAFLWKFNQIKFSFFMPVRQ
jgi:hypothetical protein